MQRLTDFELACQYARDKNGVELRHLLGIPDYAGRVPSLSPTVAEEPLMHHVSELMVFDGSIDHLLCNGENLFTYLARNGEHDAVRFLFFTLKKSFYENKSEFEVELEFVRSILSGYQKAGNYVYRKDKHHNLAKNPPPTQPHCHSCTPINNFFSYFTLQIPPNLA